MTVTSAEPTVEQIRRVALDLFAAEGYDRTSIRDIAAAVGIRGGSMYHHFSSKEEILWDLTASALDALSAQSRAHRDSVSGDDPTEQLRAFVRAHVAFHVEHRAAATLVNQQLVRLRPEHYARAVELRHAYERELTAIVRACVAAGADVPDVRVTVFAILQMMTAVSHWYQIDGPLPPKQLAGIYEALAVKMLALP